MLRQTSKAWFWLGVLACAWSSTAQAGPMEILDAVSISPSKPDNMVLSYTYGSHGVFVSSDGGKTLKWLCSPGADITASNRTFVAFASGDGSLYWGNSNGLLRADADGCNFEVVPELAMKNVRAFAADPIKPERTYLATSTGMMADNGLFMREGEGDFVPFGSQFKKFIATLHVVKNGDARRFYETSVFSNVETNKVEYALRVSDDEAMTWTEEAFDTTQFPVMDKVEAVFEIVAIDPKNPDHVVAAMTRHMKAPDTLIFSKQKGKAGTWEKLAEVTELGGVAFNPDGELYFGDNDYMTKGLFKASSLGEAPKQVTDQIRITCLTWDESRKRLLGCSNNYHFGVLDTESGALTPMLDMRCAEHAVSCADKPEIQELCQPPAIEFCKIDHWVIAPLCKVYDRGPDCAMYASTQGYTCEDGNAVPSPSSDAGVPASSNLNAQACTVGGAAAEAGSAAAGSGGSSAAAAGSGASAGRASAAAGGGQSAGDAAGGGGEKSSGCSCSAVGAAGKSQAGLFAFGMLMLGFGLRRKLRAQR